MNLVSFMYELETGKRYALTTAHEIYSGLGVDAPVADGSAAAGGSGGEGDAEAGAIASTARVGGTEGAHCYCTVLDVRDVGWLSCSLCSRVFLVVLFDCPWPPCSLPRGRSRCYRNTIHPHAEWCESDPAHRRLRGFVEEDAIPSQVRCCCCCCSPRHVQSSCERAPCCVAPRFDLVEFSSHAVHHLLNPAVVDLFADNAVIVAETGRNVIDLKDFQKVCTAVVCSRVERCWLCNSRVRAAVSPWTRLRPASWRM